MPSAHSLHLFDVSQVVSGGHIARGFNYLPMRRCLQGEPRSWSVVIDSDSGWAFQEGAAEVSIDSTVWDGFARSHDAHSEHPTVVAQP